MAAFQFLALLFCLVFSMSSLAGVETLTYERIQEILETTAPELRIARSESFATEANYGRAWSGAYPNISVNSAILANLFTARQTIFDGGKLIGQIRQAREEDKVAKIKIQDRVNIVTTKVTEGFFTSAMLIKQRENIREYFDELKKLSAYISKAGSVKRASVESVRTIKSQRDIFASRVEQTDLSIQSVLQKLAADLGYDEITADQIRESLSVSVININEIQNWTQNSLLFDPTVLVAKQQENIINEQRTVALSDDNPQINLFATLGVGGSGDSSKSYFSNYASGFRFGILLNIPIFSGLSSVHKKNFYSEKIKQANLLAEQVKLQSETDIKIRAKRIVSNLRVVNDMEDSRVGIRQEWDLSKRELKAELITPSGFVAAGRSFLDSEENYYQLVRQILTDYNILRVRSEVAKKFEFNN